VCVIVCVCVCVCASMSSPGVCYLGDVCHCWCEWGVESESECVSVCSEHVYMAELGRVEKFLHYQCQTDTCIKDTHTFNIQFILIY